jgi:hypothetical protein
VLPQRQTPLNAKQLSFRVELLKTAAGRPPLDGRPPPLDALVCASIRLCINSKYVSETR